MRRIKELLRLSAAGRSQREIALALGLANGTVSGYLNRARRAGVVWPQAAEWDDAALERALFPPPPDVPVETRGMPDFVHVHREFKRKGVTLFLLWEEYKAAHPEGFGYSWFCQHYQAFAGKVDVVMRQTHRAGEATFVDYAGHTVGVVDRATGEERHAQVFVAVLGASNYTYAEATWTQGLADWIASHQRAFRFFSGVSATVVPDNLKAGVTRPHRYEPELNRTYAEMAAHYGTADAARTRRKTAGQGESRDERVVGGKVDPCPAAPPDLLQPRRAQPRHRRAAGAAQRASVPQTPRFAPRTL